MQQLGISEDSLEALEDDSKDPMEYRDPDDELVDPDLEEDVDIDEYLRQYLSKIDAHRAEDAEEQAATPFPPPRSPNIQDIIPGLILKQFLFVIVYAEMNQYTMENLELK